MMILISTFLEILAAAVILVPVYLVLNRTMLHNPRKIFLYCLISFYLTALFTITGMPNITYIRVELNLNWIPVIGMIEDMRSTVLNVLLFVPLGILLPIVWQKYRTGKNTVLFGLGMSLVIELLQIFTFRATDINDLITNTAGTFLGFFIASILMRKIPTVKSFINEKKTWELHLVCAIAFLVMFFVQPFIFSFLWDLIMH